MARKLGLKAVSGSRFEGLVAGRSVVLTKIGIGPTAAANALSRLGPAEDFHCALSVGFAGALQPGMATGDLVVDIQGAAAELPPAAREIAAALKIPLHFGKIIHSDRVLARPSDKKALGQTRRASAVDMETSVIRSWAAKQGIASLAARVVLDGVDDRLPSSVPAGEDFASLTRYALANAAELPVMLSTGLKQRKAIANLAHFLERFLPLL